MSDGEVSVPVVLSDAAWEAYDKGIAEEEGDEPRKGDLLICKRIVVVSTHWGPIDERITFRVDELEYAGNIRKPIGETDSVGLLSISSLVMVAKLVGRYTAFRTSLSVTRAGDETLFWIVGDV